MQKLGHITKKYFNHWNCISVLGYSTFLYQVFVLKYNDRTREVDRDEWANKCDHSLKKSAKPKVRIRFF